MRVRYFVIQKDHQFEVYREAVEKGRHTFRSRAVDAATTMARLEARLGGTPTEVVIEQAAGQFQPGERFDPPRRDGAALA